jgi:hypothetical protein
MKVDDMVVFLLSVSSDSLAEQDLVLESLLSVLHPVYYMELPP